MKKTLLLLTVLVSTAISAYSQKESIPSPAASEALNRLKTDPVLHKLIKERTGYDYAKLKLVKTYNWAKFYTEDGDLRRNRWVEDGINIAYDLETPKDKDGTYSQYQIFIDYRRSECNMNGCLLTDAYKFYRYQVGTEFKKGFKEFSGEEKMKLVKEFIKTNGALPLNDFITIDKFEERTGYAEEVISPTQQIIKYIISGKIALYNADRTRIVKLIDIPEDPDSYYVSLYISQKNGKWVGDSISFNSNMNKMYYYQNYSANEMEKEMYASLKEVGFEGVYQKLSKTNMVKGMHEKLNERNNEFYNLLVNKAEQITPDDILPYMLAGSYIQKSKEEQLEILKKALEIDPTQTSMNLLTQFTIDQQFNFSYDDFFGERNKKIELHTAKVIVNGTKSTYKSSKGKPKKGKTIEPPQDVKLKPLWVWDPITKNWYIQYLGIIKF